MKKIILVIIAVFFIGITVAAYLYNTKNDSVDKIGGVYVKENKLFLNNY